MLYKNLKFASRRGRPAFYTNFVSTLDGKVWAGKQYWPIGSRRDHEVLLELRGYADALIHGRATATEFPTVKSLAEQKNPLLYIVVSALPDAKLIANLRNADGIRPLLATTKKATLPRGTAEVADVVRLGEAAVDLKRFARHLAARGIRQVLVEGGPTLLGAFFAANLVDEVFLTLVPKIFGSAPGKTISMVEGVLLSPQKVKRFKLVGMQKAGDEVFLRYRAFASSPLKRGG